MTACDVAPAPQPVPIRSYDGLGVRPLTSVNGLKADVPRGNGHMAEERVQRRLAAILAADVVGYPQSRQPRPPP